MFTDDDVTRCAALFIQPVQPMGNDDLRRATVRRIMEETATLLAARGGTMTEPVLGMVLRDMEGTFGNGVERVRAHIAAQGANLALLQSALNDVAEVVLGDRPTGVMPSTTADAVRALKSEKTVVELAHRIQARHATLLDLLLPYAAGEEGNRDVVGRVKRLLLNLGVAEAQLRGARAGRTDADAECARLRQDLHQATQAQNEDAALLHQSDQERLYWKAEHAKLLGERDAALIRAEQAEERVRQLAVAGQALSEHVDETADSLEEIERVAEESAFERGAEAMRAACLEAVDRVCDIEGIGIHMRAHFTSVIEGAAP